MFKSADSLTRMNMHAVVWGGDLNYRDDLIFNRLETMAAVN